MQTSSKLIAMTICALMDTHETFEKMCSAILRTQGFEDLPDEEIDNFFDALDEQALDEVYSAVFNMKVELENAFKELEEVLSAKEI
jgi:hypothetical protein